MKSFREHLQEVEGPRSELDKLAFKEHPVQTKEYPVKNAGERDVKTKKDKTRSADQQGGKDVKAYADDNGVKTDPMKETPLYPVERSYSKAQIMQYFKPEHLEIDGEQIDEISIQRTKDYHKASMRKDRDDKDDYARREWKHLKGEGKLTSSDREKLLDKLHKRAKFRTLGAMKRSGSGVKVPATEETETKVNESFASVQKKISSSEHIPMKNAGAILANASRHASAAAKRKNPKLKRVKEDLEVIDDILDQLDEVSRERLKSYLDKVKPDVDKQQNAMYRAKRSSDPDDVVHFARKKQNRVKGVEKAEKKLKEEVAVGDDCKPTTKAKSNGGSATGKSMIKKNKDKIKVKSFGESLFGYKPKKQVLRKSDSKTAEPGGDK